MRLDPGTRLGPYEVLAPLGAGGMGEVYRARDTQLGRDVALKVMPEALGRDPHLLARFEREAKLLAQLNHPNIAHLYGLETGGEQPALVMELVEGPTLAERLERGALDLRDSLEIARQIAEALEDAHERGIVHRDLKPQNVKLTADGRVKVLDFGLAKALEPPEASQADRSLAHSPTLTLGTHEGTILGTAAYMAPEQARGERVDRRADVWAFGVVLYEMLAGRRLFEGRSTPDVLGAVLRQELDFTSLPDRVPASIRRLLRRAVERDPHQRLHDVADARLVIEDVLHGAPDFAPPVPARRRRWPALALAAAAVVAALIAAYSAGRAWRSRPTLPHATFKALTYRSGHFVNARFAPDGQTVFYAAAWEGEPRMLFQARPGAGGELAIGFPGADLLAVSRSGELALLLPRIRGPNPYWKSGTLALAPASGGTPRDVAEDVVWADFAADDTLAVIRESPTGRRLEWPLGKVIHRVPHQDLAWPRVSRDDRRVALFEREGGLWSVITVDRSGRREVLTSGWLDWWNLAWSPDGREVWFAASRAAEGSALRAVDATGQVRTLLEAPGSFELHDVGRDGHVLVSQVYFRGGLIGRSPDAPQERNLDWLGSATSVDLSADGRQLLLDGESEREQGAGGVYLRAMDGSPAVRLGSGIAQDLSSDARWALALRGSAIVALPTGAGAERSRSTQLRTLLGASFLADDDHFVAAGAEPGGELRLFVGDFGTAPLRPVGAPIQPRAPGTFRSEIDLVASHSGRLVAYADAEGRIQIVPLDGSSPTALPGASLNEVPAAWSADDKSLLVFDPGELPARVAAVDIGTGRRRLVREVSPLDRTGVSGILRYVTNANGTAYAYTCYQFESTLYLAEGLE